MSWFDRLDGASLLCGITYAGGCIGVVVCAAHDLGAGPAVALGVILAMAGFGAAVQKGFL